MAKWGGDDDIDAFEDDSDIDLHVATKEYDRLRQSRIKDGYRSGFEAGQETTLQSGFNQGYCEGVHTAYQINYMKGLLSALKAYHEQTEEHVFSTLDKQTIRDTLQELETLEQSHNAMLKQTISSDDPMSTTDQQSSLLLSGNPEQTESTRSRDKDVSAISRDLNEMHIMQSNQRSELGYRDEAIDASRPIQDAGGAITQRLAEMSQRCRILFAQLDIQNLLQ